MIDYSGNSLERKFKIFGFNKTEKYEKAVSILKNFATSIDICDDASLSLTNQETNTPFTK